MIHAYAATAAGQPLKPFKYPAQELKADDVEITIECCGLCHSDLHILDDDWKNSKYPVVPGHEIIGKITRKGKDVADFEIGERVGLGWQCGACLKCEFCVAGDETVCSSKIRTCIERYGGFADKVITDSRFVYLIPDELDSLAAAPLLCAGITSYSPFIQYGVQAPQSIAVIGIGGLGHLALQFAKAFGCEVTAISSSPNKEEEAKKFGADHFLSLTDTAGLKKAMNSFHFMISTVTAELDWGFLGQLLRPHGKLCFIGLPSSDIKIPVRLLVSGNRCVCGSGTGSRTHMKEMLEFCARHNIRAQVEALPMGKINEAVKRLKANQARYRIVLTNSP